MIAFQDNTRTVKISKCQRRNDFFSIILCDATIGLIASRSFGFEDKFALVSITVALNLTFSMVNALITVHNWLIDS